MAGITSLLNVAKVGILTHQVSMHVTGNNVSNVNTPGYSRQSVTLSPAYPTPSTVGPIGNGVNATGVVRNYDRFITTTLFDKTSVMSGLETRQFGMKLIEGILNEVDENGLNELMNRFWSAWEDLADNAEGMAERTSLLQQASLLADGIRDRYNRLVKLSHDVDLNIETAVSDINRISRGIAELNVQIVSLEAGGHQANDLRDQRDELVRDLSKLADVRYFETKRGSYTVLIGQGSPLVEDDRSWELEMRAGDVYWKESTGDVMRLTTEDVAHGELGAWLDVKSRVSPRDMSVLTASRANTSAGQGIRPATLWSQIDGVTVTGPFQIAFSGTDRNGHPVSATYDSTVDYDADGTTGQVSDFLSAIETTYGAADVDATLDPDGRLVLQDIHPGDVPISFQIEGMTGGITGLDLGRFDGSYPENYLERLDRMATELIKAVNEVHSQGSGLVPFTEAAALHGVTDMNEPVSWRSSGLEFSDQVRNGAFEIWVYDANGDVIDLDPSTAGVNDPWRMTVTDGVTTIQDIVDAVNDPVSGIPGITASAPGGRLVLAVDGTSQTSGFAFGTDTSGVLSALGLNAFFDGTDASTISVNSVLMEDPRYVAAARVEVRGNADVMATVAVREPARPLGVSVTDGTFTVSLYDQTGALQHTETISVDADVTTLEDVMDAINRVDGLHSEVANGVFTVSSTRTGWTVNVSDSGNDLLAYLGITPPGTPQESISGVYQLDRTFEPFADFTTGVASGSFQVDLFDADGNPVAGSPFTVPVNPATDGLDDVAAAIDAVPGLAAGVEDGRLRISAEGNAASFVLRNDTTGVLSYLGLATSSGGTLNPANNANALEFGALGREGIAALDGATFSEAYSGLVGTVGIHSRGIGLDYEFTRSAVAELEARRDEVSGVSLDEELANLLRFQHAYSAAAKLIKVADEMFLSIIETK
ncbi:MAG: flagellar hook-associated protein FlgK [Deltaproteobacteria bacterium]